MIAKILLIYYVLLLFLFLSLITLLYILNNINKYFVDDDNDVIIKKDILTDTIELINNYIDIIKMIDDSEVNKEMEREIIIEWNNIIK